MTSRVAVLLLIGGLIGVTRLATAQGSKPATALPAGTPKVDITPQTPKWLSGYQARQSTGVLDPIFHRVLALEAGDTEFYLISSDLCLFSPSLYDEVTSDLQKETGSDPKHVLWSVTHTHAAPEIGPPDCNRPRVGVSCRV